MAKSQTKKTSKKKKKSLPRPMVGVVIVILSLAIYLGVVWFYVTQTYHTQPLPTRHVVTNQTFSSPDYSKSLDLRIAARASYPSAPITEVKDLGSSDNFDQQIVSFKVTTDHLTEFALLMQPAGPPPANGWPVIILCHGYYDPSQYDTTVGYLDDMNFYAQHGFAVIKPDYRGQGLSYNQGSADGAYYSMSYNTDVMSLISAVKQTGNLNKKNINLWGHSMGAYVALRAAILSPDVKNVILLSGPVGYPQDLFSLYTAPSDADNPIALKLRQSELLKYGTPITNPKFWDTTAPIDFLSNLKANVQINVGSDDEVVPAKFSAELNNELGRAHKAHQYYVYDGGDHGLIPFLPLIWQHSLQAMQT